MADQPDSTSDLIALFTRHRHPIAAYAYAILHDVHAVDDVLQEVAMVILRKQDKWTADRPFLPWALTITRFECLHVLRRRRIEHACVDDDILARLADHLAQAGEEADRRRQAALMLCIEQAGDQAAEVLKQKYVEDLAAEEIAAQRGSSVTAVYSLLQRLRSRLQDCVERRLAQAAV